MKRIIFNYLLSVLFFLLSNQVYSMKPESDVELISAGLSSLSLQDLPNELLINIVSFYNTNRGVINFVHSLCKLRPVSKKFKALLTDDNIKHICKQVGFNQLSDEDKKHLSKNKNEKAVKLLILSGLVNLPDRNGFTLMHCLTNQGAANLMKKVIDVGGNVNAKTNQPPFFTPLHLAAGHGEVEVAKLLLNKGADIEAKDKHGQTPLHLAVRYVHVGTTNLLLVSNANPCTIALYKGKPVKPYYYVAGFLTNRHLEYAYTNHPNISGANLFKKIIRIRTLLKNAERRWEQRKKRTGEILNVQNNYKTIFKLARSL